MTNETIQNIALDLIEPSPGNRRVGGVNEAKLNQLAESIRSVGVQQPAVVRPKGEMYEIVCGERRWRASKVAGLDFLPCRVRDLTDAQALHIQIIENVQREDVHPFDEADGYDRLRRDGGFEVEQIAAEVGRTTAHVYQRLKLLALIPKARDLFMDEKINTAVAIQIARLDADQQQQVLNTICAPWRLEQGITAKAVEEFIQREIMHELSKAAWSKTDAALIPEAGACSACPKRTGANRDLFDDFNPKKDNCLNGACFQAKAKALVEKRRKELEGTEHLIVKDTWTNDDIPGAVDPYKWKECKKDEEGAVRVLVVAGDKPGRLTYGKMQPGYEQKAPETVKTDRARERKLTKAREDLVSAIYQDIRSVSEIALSSNETVRTNLLRLAVKAIWMNTGHDSQIRISKSERWAKPDEDSTIQSTGMAKIEDMGFDDLLIFLAVIAFAPEARPMDYYRQGIVSEKLKKAADILGIDYQVRIDEAVETSGIDAKELTKEPGQEEAEDEEEERHLHINPGLPDDPRQEEDADEDDDEEEE